MPEYEGRVRVSVRPFPLEVAGSGPAPRDILEQEWWLAAIQEPAADFAPYEGDDWPATTLPAFEAAWCAFRQGEEAGSDYDLRVRRAFFVEGRNIGRREVLLEIVEEAGLDARHFERAFRSGEPREAVLKECRTGKERYRVRGTPTVMLPDGTKLKHPIAFPTIKERKVVGVKPLPCYGEGCLDATRNLFEEALRQGSEVASGEARRPRRPPEKP
jgi:predicted DsbA family dithiol-disulfide isomerase